MIEQAGGGLRYDAGKVRVDLVPPEMVMAFAQVAGKGAEKYPERNWEKGMAFSKVYAPLMRHLLKWWMLEDRDPETDLSHLKHVLWNAAALVTYLERGIGQDDRPGKGAPGTVRAASPAPEIVEIKGKRWELCGPPREVRVGDLYITHGGGGVFECEGPDEVNMQLAGGKRQIVKRAPEPEAAPW